jgi:HPt (histidine-containing phosphotransfer) domain-containing protein
MASTANSGPELPSSTALSAAPGLSEELDKLWARFLPEMCNRATALEQAAAAYADHALTTAQHREAHAAAHKLAGTLGTFGLSRGTELALELEELYGQDKAPDAAQGEQLISLAAELRLIIESRPDTNPLGNSPLRA